MNNYFRDYGKPEVIPNKRLNSPNNSRKKNPEEEKTKIVVAQLVDQVPKKNLRNPDFLNTSVLADPLIVQKTASPKKNILVEKVPEKVNKVLEEQFNLYLIEKKEKERNEKGIHDINISQEEYEFSKKLKLKKIFFFRKEFDNFKKNYDQFYRGYTPDINSFKKYETIKKTINYQKNKPIDPIIESNIDEVKFGEDLKKFYGFEGDLSAKIENSEKKKNNISIETQPINKNKVLLSPSKKETEYIKQIQHSKYNPITNKYY